MKGERRASARKAETARKRLLRYAPVGRRTWKDLERLFESRGGPHPCWCMVWRRMKEGMQRSRKSDKKASLKSLVDTNNPVGLLCYDGNEPIAWCSIAPRATYRDLSGDDALDAVWSIVCFYVRREYRRGGVGRSLIGAAVAYARYHGARYVEAYPVDPDSPAYRFMGFVPVFRSLGCIFRGRAGLRRNVMVLKMEG